MIFRGSEGTRAVVGCTIGVYTRAHAVSLNSSALVVSKALPFSLGVNRHARSTSCYPVAHTRLKPGWPAFQQCGQDVIGLCRSVSVVGKLDASKTDAAYCYTVARLSARLSARVCAHLCPSVFACVCVCVCVSHRAWMRVGPSAWACARVCVRVLRACVFMCVHLRVRAFACVRAAVLPSRALLRGTLGLLRCYLRDIKGTRRVL